MRALSPLAFAVAIALSMPVHARAGTCAGVAVARRAVGEVASFEATVSLGGGDSLPGASDRLRLAQTLRFHLLVAEVQPDGACVVELSLSRLDILQSISGGPFVKLATSPGALHEDPSAAGGRRAGAAAAVEGAANPFYCTVLPDGRIDDVRALPGDSERTLALKKGLVSTLQLVVPPRAHAPPSAGGRAARVLREWDGAGAETAPCTPSWHSSPGAAAWAADEVDNSGVYRAVYSARCGGGGGRGLGEEREGDGLLIVTKDRTEASYYSLGHSSGGRERGASGEASLYVGHAAEYSLAPTGGVVRASIEAAAGLRQGSPFVPPPGSAASAYDNAADAPSDVPLVRVVRANVSHLGDVRVQWEGRDTDEEGAHARLLQAADESASRGTVPLLAPRFLGHDATGQPFSFHGVALLAGARRGLAGGAGHALHRQLLTTESLLVDLTPSFRASMGQSVNNPPADLGEEGRRLLAVSKTETVSHTTDATTGATVLEYLRTSKSGLHKPFYLDAAMREGEGVAGEDEEEEDAGEERDASSAHNALLRVLACIPAYMLDDALPAGKMADNAYMPCMNAMANATRANPGILVAAHRLLLTNPCINTYAGVAAVLAHPAIASRNAAAYAAAGERTTGRWLADDDGTPCDAPAVLTTRLSHRLVDLLVGLIVSAADPDAAHSEAALAHMLLRPDAYRYPTVLESALQSLIAYDSPSESIVEAALHVAFHIEDGEAELGIEMHDSQTWTLALLASGAVLHKARAFHDGGRPSWDVAGVMEALQARDAQAYADAYEAKLGAILRGRGDAAYDADVHEGKLVTYVLSRLRPALDAHDREASHRQLATETALMMWPTLPDSQRVHYLSTAEGVPERDMRVLLSLDEAAGSFSDSETAHLSVRGVAALRDHLLQTSPGAPDKLEPIRFGLALKSYSVIMGNASAWNDDHAQAVHAARLTAARQRGYDASQLSSSYHTTDVVLRVLGNIGSTHGVDVALRFLDHHDNRLRDVALRVLARSTTVHAIPERHAGGRRLTHAASDGVARLLAEYGGPAVPTALGRRMEELDRSDLFADVLPVDVLLMHSSLFPGSVTGSDASDIEGHLLSAALTHHSLDFRAEAVRALSAMRPLRYETVDAILDMYEAQFSHAGMRPEACVATCAASRPACLVLPQPECRAECETTCTSRSRLQNAVAEFARSRIQHELGDVQRHTARWADVGGFTADRLSLTSQRVEDALAADLVDELAARDANGGSFRALHDWAGGQLDFRAHAAAHLLPVVLPSTAASLSRGINGTSTRGRIVRALSQSADASSSSPALISRRALSYRSITGRALPRHLSRARNLGIFTLLDVQLGKGIKWEKVFGSNTFGARISFENRNLMKLRLTLFDGFARLEECNAAAIIANLLFFRLGIVDAKAAIVGGFAYVNKLARDIADTVTKIADKTLGYLQKAASKVVPILNGLATEIGTTVASLTTYRDEVTRVVESVRAVAPAIEASYTLADSFTIGMVSIPDIPLARRVATSVANATMRFSVATRRVITLSASGDWSSTVTDVKGRAASALAVATSYITQVSPLIVEAEAMPGKYSPPGLDSALRLFSTLPPAVESSKVAIRSAFVAASRPQLAALTTATNSIDFGVSAFSNSSNVRRTITLSPDNSAVTLSDLQYAALLNRSTVIALSPLASAVGPMARAARALQAALSDPALAGADALPPTFTQAAVGAPRSLAQSSTTVAAAQITAAITSLSTAACGALPLLRASIDGDTAARIITDFGSRQHVGRSTPVRVLSDTLARAAGLSDAVIAVRVASIFSSDGIVAAVQNVLFKLKPVVDSLVSRGDYIESMVRASQDSVPLFYDLLALSEKLFTDFNVSAPALGSTSTAARARLLKPVPALGSLPAGITALVNASMDLLRNVVLPSNEALLPISDITGATVVLNRSAAEWKARMERSAPGPDADFSTMFSTLSSAMTDFSAINAQFDDGPETVRIKVMLTVSEFLADFPLSALKDFATAISAAATLSSTVSGLSEIVTGYLEFGPKLQLLQEAMGELTSVASLYAERVEGANAAAFMSAFNAARDDLAALVNTITPWDTRMSYEAPRPFDVGVALSEASSGVLQSVKREVNATRARIASANLTGATLFTSLSAIRGPLASALRAFNDAAMSIEGAKTLYGFWYTLMYPPVGPSVPSRWGKTASDLAAMLRYKLDVETLASLSKVLVGGVDDSRCAALGAANGDVAAVYSSFTSGRQLAAGDRCGASSPDGSCAVAFDADEEADVGTTRVHVPAAPVPAARLLQASSSRAILTSGDVARLAAIGLTVDPAASSTSFGSDFCFGPAAASGSAECTALNAALAELLPRVAAAADAFSVTRMAGIASDITHALTTAPVMAAALSGATSQILTTFDSAAKALNATLSDAVTGRLIVESAATAEQLRAANKEIVRRFASGVALPMAEFERQFSSIISTAPGVISGLTRSAAFVASLPRRAALAEALMGQVPHVVQLVDVVRTLQPDIVRLASRVEPVAADILTYSPSAVASSLDSFVTAQGASETAVASATALPDLIMTIINFIEVALNFGISSVDLPARSTVEWCRAEEVLATLDGFTVPVSTAPCVRTIARAGAAWRRGIYQLRYTQYYDNASPPVLGQGMFDRYQWIIPGLFESWDCRGVAWYDQDTVVLGCQSMTSEGVWGKWTDPSTLETVLRPSMLVFLSADCARPTGMSKGDSYGLNLAGTGEGCSMHSKYVKKMLQLWLDDTHPIFPRAGGVLPLGGFVYVADDTPPAPDKQDSRKSLLFLFSRADIDAALDDDSAYRVMVTTHPDVPGVPLVIDAPATPSSLSYDGLGGGNDRLWLTEEFNAVEETAKYQPDLLCPIISALLSSFPALADLLLAALGYGSRPWTTKSHTLWSESHCDDPEECTDEEDTGGFLKKSHSFGFLVSVAEGTVGLPVGLAYSSEDTWTSDDTVKGEELDEDLQDSALWEHGRFSLLKGLDQVRTVTFEPGVTSAHYGYDEYTNGPLYAILTRCPSGEECKLEFHNLTNFNENSWKTQFQMFKDSSSGKAFEWDLSNPKTADKDESEADGKGDEDETKDEKAPEEAAPAKEEAATPDSGAAEPAAATTGSERRRRMTGFAPIAAAYMAERARRLSPDETAASLPPVMGGRRLSMEDVWPEVAHRTAVVSALRTYMLGGRHGSTPAALENATAFLMQELPHAARRAEALPRGARKLTSSLCDLSAKGSTESTRRRLGSARRSTEAVAGDEPSVAKEEEKKEEEEEEDPKPVSLKFVLRAPPGVRSIAYEPEWSTSIGNGFTMSDLSRARHLLVLTNAASSAQFSSFQGGGQDVDDTLYKMRLPVLVSQAPSLTDNILYFRILNFDLFTPRCMIPMGKLALDSGEEQKNVWCSDECKKESSAKARLLYSHVAVNRDAADIRAAVPGLGQQQRLQSSINHVQPAHPLRAHFTVVRTATSASGSSSQGRSLAEAATDDVRFSSGTAVDAPYRVIYSTPSPTSPRWARHLEEAKSACEPPEKPKGDDVADAGGSKPKAGDKGKTEEEKEDELPGKADKIEPTFLTAREGCITAGPFELARKYITLFKLENTVIVIVVPVTFFFEVGAELVLTAGARLCLADKEIAFALIPTAGIQANAGAGVDFGVKAGIGFGAIICQMSLVPMLSFGITPGGSLRVCLEMQLEIIPVGMHGFAWWRFPICFSLKYLKVSKTLTIPIIVVEDCSLETHTFFKFTLPAIVIKLFAVCSGPKDRTPPTKGWVKCKQADVTSIVITWGAFIDTDTNIDHYEVQVGTAPGQSNVLSRVNAGAALSYLVTGVNVPHLSTYYCAVEAFNGERMSTSAVSKRMFWSDRPVLPVGVRVLRPLDGEYVGVVCSTAFDAAGRCLGDVPPVYVPSPSELYIAFRLGDTNPMSVSIARAVWAICGEPLCLLQDLIALPWAEVGRAKQLKTQSRTHPIATSTLVANMSHGGLYFAAVSLYASMGLVGYSAPSVPIICDLTPPTPGEWVRDGPVPGVDVAYLSSDSVVSGSWAPFLEDVSPIMFYTFSVVDASGSVVVAPTDVGLETSATADALLFQGLKYFVVVTATNAAGTSSEPLRSDGFIVDSSGPAVWPVAVLVVPWITDSWLADIVALQTPALCASRGAACTNVTSTQWTAPYSSAAAAAGLPVDTPKGASRTSSTQRRLRSSVREELLVKYEAPLWGAAMNATVQPPSWDARLISGDAGPLMTIRARWACGDDGSFTELGSGVGRTAVAVGTCPGCMDALPFSDVVDAVHPLDAPAASWLAPEDYDEPGVHRAVRFGVYFDAIVRVPTFNLSGSRLYAMIKCVNGAGEEGLVNALPSVLFDPQVPEIPDAPAFMPGLGQGQRNWAYSINTTHFLVTWKEAVTHGPSGLADGRFHSLSGAYAISLGSAPGTSDISSSRTLSGTDFSAAYAGLRLPHNTTVYATLTAYTAAVPPVVQSFVALPVLIDLTPPVLVSVSDGASGMPGAGGLAWTYRNRSVAGEGDVQFLPYVAATFANWVGFDLESGIDSYNHSTVDAATGTVLASITFAGETTRIMRPLTTSLPNGGRVINVVTAFNRAGLNSSRSSNGVTYDGTAPELTRPTFSGTARFLPPGSLLSQPGGAAIPVISSASPFLSYNWTASDPLSGVPECWWQLGSYVGGDDMLGWTSVNASVSLLAAASALGLLSGATYYPAVQCANGAGIISRASSLLGVGVDVVSPYIGRVLDVASPSAVPARTYTSNGTTAVVSFPDVADVHSALSSCAVGLGTGAGSDAAMTSVSRGWVAAAASTSVVLSGLNLTPGAVTYSFVKCEDIVGNIAVASSAGFVYDTTPPVLSAPIRTGLLHAIDSRTGIVNMSAPNQLFTFSTSSLGVRFRGVSDPESGILTYHLAVSTDPSLAAAPTVMPFTPAGSNPFFLINGLQLMHGQTYYVLVRVFNRALLNATFASPGITVDTSPPVCAFVRLVTPSSAVALASDPAAIASIARLVTATTAEPSVSLAAVYACSDPESGVASAAFAVGTYPSDASVVPLTPAALPQSSSITSGWNSVVSLIVVPAADLTRRLPIDDAATFFMSLLVQNGAGAPTVMYSGGITYDATPPVLSPGQALLDGPGSDGADLVALDGAASQLTGSFSFRDLSSSVASIAVALAFHRGSLLTSKGVPPLGVPSVQDAAAAATFVAVPQSAAASIVSGTYSLPIPASLSTAIAAASASGAAPYTLYAILRATNGVGLTSLARTSGVVMDSTPPVCSPMGVKNGTPLFVLDGLGVASLEPAMLSSGDVDVTPNGAALSGRWKCTDAMAARPVAAAARPVGAAGAGSCRWCHEGGSKVRSAS